MDARLTEILDSLPPKEPRSRLEPYRELIREMRRRGRTYREIVEVLGERCGVRVASSTVHEFVTRRSRAKPGRATEAALLAFSKPEVPAGGEPQLTASVAEGPKPSPEPDEVRQRIEALKQRATPAAGAGPAKPLFSYNENEPLRVGKAGGR